MCRVHSILAGVAFLAACADTSPTAPTGDVTASRSQVLERSGIATGRAVLHPINRSGVRGRVEFTDDGSTLTIHGVARGLDPAGTYISLIYDNGSPPRGPNACEPTIFDPADPGFLLPTMLVGNWTVDGDGNGTLTAVNIQSNITGTRVYVPLGKFKTISIRQVVPPFTPPFPLLACGEKKATHQAKR